MVDYKYKDLFWKSHVDKQLKIATDDGLLVAANEDIHFEDFELTESLCSDSELRFGSCEASMVKFQIRNAFISLAGKWITITETLDGNTDELFKYGKYKVFSDVPTADKEYRDIIAYDAMYDILNADVSAWYNTILPNEDSKVTMKQFRERFMQHFGISEQLPKDGLANDNIIVERTIEPEQISGKDIITAICEINGCFGHIGRDGKFYYIYLPQDIQGLYPADFLYPDHVPEQWDYLSQAKTGHLYPQDPKGIGIGTGQYIKCQYEDYVVQKINRLQIRQEENDIGIIYPKTEPSDKDNSYIIQDNFLAYGKTAEELDVIAENIYGKIKGIIYRPFNADCIGNPCLEVGDAINIQTKYKIIESYILKRTLKGIQLLKDNYSSSGQEYRNEKVNSIQKSVIQLKGKTNILTRDIDKTRLEMADMEKGLSAAISLTTAELRAELQNTESGLESEISQTAAQIRTEVLNADMDLSTRIVQNAEGITAEVTRATGAEDNLSSRITLTEKGLSTKVTQGNISSEISQEAGKINITSNRFSLNSDNCSISEDGVISAKNVDLSGVINAEGGKIGLFTLDETEKWLEYYKDEQHVCGLGATAAIYAGSANSMQAPFHVTYDGKMYAEHGEIAGWEITPSGLKGQATIFGETFLSSNGRLRVNSYFDENNYLAVEMSPGFIRLDAGDEGVIYLNGVAFTKQQLKKLQELVGGEPNEQSTQP